MTGTARRVSLRLAAALVLVLAACRNAQPPAGAPRPRAVVLLTVDTLRADAVSFLNPSRVTTPFLDRLAEQGVVFTAAYAPSSWTAPSIASLITGLPPSAHGVVLGEAVQFGTPRSTVVGQPLLAASLSTLAERFAEAGWTTIGVPANRHLQARLGFGQGFRHYWAPAPFASAGAVNEQVRRHLRQAFGESWPTSWKGTPTFLWIHYFDPHAPYLAREPWIGEYARDWSEARTAYPSGWTMRRIQRTFVPVGPAVRARLEPLYLSEVRFADHMIEALDADIGLSDPDVLLIFTSDHGEEFGEHGGLGHGGTLYEEVVRVPLFVRWPAGLARRGRITRPVSLLDVLPTVARLAGLAVPSGLPGRDLFDEPGTERAVFFETDRSQPPSMGVRLGRWKLIRGRYSPLVLGLYDLQTDPGESADRFAAEPRAADRLLAAIERAQGQWPPPPPDARVVEVDDPALAERLRALGYGD